MFQLLLLELPKYFNEEEINLVIKAHQYASNKHEGVFRDSGEPYITHPENVAYILFDEMGLHDVNSVCAAILHDVIEDTATDKEEIAREFNPEIAFLVDAVSKIKNINFISKTQIEQDNTCLLLRKLIMDYRVILIKLADRLHNMRTIEFKKIKKKAHAKSLETLQLFVPIADRIGAYNVKCELEDLCFKDLYSSKYKEIKGITNDYIVKHQSEIEDILNNIRNELNNEGIKNVLRVKFKNAYALYKELKVKQKMSTLPDLISYQIEVETLKECYLALMIMHEKYKVTNKGYFRDFISSVKPNGYRAIHTTVTGFKDHYVQMQIFTEKMGLINKYGFAVLRDLYPDKSFREIQEYLMAKDSFMASIKEIEDLYIIDNDNFLKQVYKELLKEQVQVYAKDGTMYSFPKGASVLDFAYKIHSEIGDKASSALVNSKVVGLNYVLKNEDVIEVITDEYKLKQDISCLDFVVTAIAKRKIKEGVKEQGRIRTK